AHRDAAFNLSRMGVLIAGLADHRLLVAAATEDRLHQGPRSTLFPQAPAILAGLVDSGALASCWSGAGPSLLGICVEDSAKTVAQAAAVLIDAHGIPGEVLVLAPDLVGVALIPSPAH
nr:homoserine kinase [Actinomycetota bacterium]